MAFEGTRGRLARVVKQPRDRGLVHKIVRALKKAGRPLTANEVTQQLAGPRIGLVVPLLEALTRDKTLTSGTRSERSLRGKTLTVQEFTYYGLAERGPALDQLPPRREWADREK